MAGARRQRTGVMILVVGLSAAVAGGMADLAGALTSPPVRVPATPAAHEVVGMTVAAIPTDPPTSSPMTSVPAAGAGSQASGTAATFTISPAPAASAPRYR